MTANPPQQANYPDEKGRVPMFVDGAKEPKRRAVHVLLAIYGFEYKPIPGCFFWHMDKGKTFVTERCVLDFATKGLMYKLIATLLKYKIEGWSKADEHFATNRLFAEYIEGPQRLNKFVGVN